MKLLLRKKLIQEGIMDGLQLYIQNKYNDLKNFIETDKLKEKIQDNFKNQKELPESQESQESQSQGINDASLPNVG